MHNYSPDQKHLLCRLIIIHGFTGRAFWIYYNYRLRISQTNIDLIDALDPYIHPPAKTPLKYINKSASTRRARKLLNDAEYQSKCDIDSPYVKPHNEAHFRRYALPIMPRRYNNYFHYWIAIIYNEMVKINTRQVVISDDYDVWKFESIGDIRHGAYEITHVWRVEEPSRAYYIAGRAAWMYSEGGELPFV